MILWKKIKSILTVLLSAVIAIFIIVFIVSLIFGLGYVIGLFIAWLFHIQYPYFAIIIGIIFIISAMVSK